MRFKLPPNMGVDFATAPKGVTRVEYVAYQTGEEKRVRLKICPAMQYWRRLPYALLSEMGENGIAGTELILGFPRNLIIVKGTNLKPIADAIAEERCEWIQAFDDRRHRLPADLTLPFIGLISILASVADDAPPVKKPTVEIESQSKN